MSRADSGKLERLHGVLATKLAELIDAIDKDTKGSASILNVVRQFLKDNGIDGVDAPGTPLDNLRTKATEFPFDPEKDSRLN